ncbi:MAG: hypothetical protein JWO38_609 [Gemmataceae bacterium]|nr:hypothetical protein [Gemmataceae bacterium]
MSARYLLAATAAVLLAAPAGAADTPAATGKPKPTAVVQTQPAGKLLADVQDLIRLAAGPGKGEAAVKRFQRDIEDELGEKGFEGLDLNRPAAGYATVKEKVADSTIVLVVPVTTEKDFLGLLDRLKFKTTEMKGKKGLYQLVPPDADLFPHDSYVRVADGWAYVGFNGDDVVDPANLIPVAELIDPQQDAQIAARIYPDRFPEKLLKTGLTQLEDGVNGFKQFLLPQDKKAVAKGLGTIIDEGLKLLRRTAEGLQKDGREIILRYSYDPAAGMALEVTVVPKPGTELAKAVAARAPTTNRFAGLVGKDAVVGVVGQAPLFAPETREMAAALFEMLESLAETEEGVPEPLRPVAAAVCKGLTRTVKAGDGDFAVVLLGPDKDGRFTGVGAVAFDDPSGVEKALRVAVEKNALFKKLVTLDADKTDGVSLHTIAVGSFLDEDFVKAFGKDAVVCLAFGKGAVYAAVGPAGSAVSAVKTAVAVKGGPAPAAEMVGNPARVVKLITLEKGDQEAKQFAAVLGNEDKRISVWGVTIAGGEKLTIRITDRMLFLSPVFSGGTPAEPGMLRR